MSGSTIAIIIIIVALLVILFTSYVKSPPDKAYIISGLRKTPKILIGKAGLKLPFFERKLQADQYRYQDGRLCSDTGFHRC